MNTSSTNRLYQLLPAIYRERAIYRDSDPDPGELKHLLEIIENALESLETDIGDLYENWFIETCDDWVVAYIGDLLGVGGIGGRNNVFNQHSQAGVYGQQESRAYVANTLAYRRRKGTAPVLEQLVRDVTGWRARAVEFFDRLAITQNLNHLRLDNTTVNLKAPNRLQLLGSPFEQKVAYSAELLQVATGQGKYNVANIGLFIWRLQSYPIYRGTAHAVQDQNLAKDWLGRCYTFNPLMDSLSVPLFNPPQPETDITDLAKEINVPGQLRTDPSYDGYQGQKLAFQIFVNGQSTPIPPQEVLITHLYSSKDPQGWILPQERPQPAISGTPQPTKVVAVDPESGRIAFLDQVPPSQVEVTYAYGFSADMGGGPYDRSDTMAQIPPETLPHPSDRFFPSLYWEVEQACSGSPNPLADAVQTWNGTVKAWQACYDQTFIPLARIEIPKQRVQQASLQSLGEPLRPRWQFGIVTGSNLIADLGSKQLIITPGQAIDAQGRLINLNQNTLIDLDKITPRLPRKQPLLVTLSYWADRLTPSYELNVISPAQLEDYPEETYVRLGSIGLDAEGKIETLTESGSSSCRAGTIHAGIVEGLTVLTPCDVLEAIVTPGLAVDRLGQVILLDRNIPLDLRHYQGQTIWVAIAYADSPSGGNWQLYILLNEDAQDQTRYPLDRYIRLAKLSVPQIQITQQEMPSSLRRQFIAGIVQGLCVKADVGDRTVTITAGKALDETGQEIVLERDYRLKGLGRYCNPLDQPVTLAIVYRQTSIGPDWQLKILRANDAANSEEQYLRLATLQISPTGRIKAKTDISSKFKPGVIKNTLQVTATQSGCIRVSDGKAVDRLGQVVTLKQSCEVDLSKYPGRALVLFIADQQGQGWKALESQDVETTDVEQSWRHLGTVPEPPPKPQTAVQPPKTGVIVIKDNHTYVGDLTIEIPTSQNLQLRFQLLAASGYRPHVQGNVFVRGIVDPDSRQSPEFESGACLLNGLLMEGKLTIRPGDLRQFSINHCTLVPKSSWGLLVEAVQPAQNLADRPDSDGDSSQSDSHPADDCNETGGFLFLLLAVFCLIIQLFKIGFNSHHLSPRQRLEQLTQYMMAEIEKLWCAFQEELYQCQRLDTASNPNSSAAGICDWLCGEPEKDELDGDNADLEITINHSIVGPVSLASSVPDLVIQDSIVDEGSTTLEKENGQAALAIAAPGSEVDIQRSTILGTTNVRHLVASTSLFTGVISVVDRQRGCMRFCYVPVGSKTPLRYRCQPDLALQELPNLPVEVTALMIKPTDHKPLLGTSGQGVLQLIESPSSTPPETWDKTNLTDQFITALARYDRSDGTTVFWAGAAAGKMFWCLSDQLKWQSIEAKLINSDITALLTYTQPLSGTISSQGTTITGVGTAFTAELHPGDTITVWLQDREHPRTVNTIESVTSLTIDEAFTSDLPPGTPFKISFLLAGTAGNGVWRFTESGGTWTQKPISQGIEAYSISSLAIDSQRRIFAGTTSGVFRWSAKRQRWQAVNQGLTRLQITALVVDANDQLFAGTTEGFVFRSLDRGKHWTSVSNGLTRARVTSMVVQSITGQGQLDSTTLVVTEINDSDPTLVTIEEKIAKHLKRGSTITISNQTRVIQSIQGTTLKLNAEFCPDLAGGVTFTSHYLFVGTAGNGIWRSPNKGNTWEAVSLSVMRQQITALAVDAERHTIWAGSAIGSVFRSHNHGEQWQAVNQGLKDVDKLIPILLQIQPRFTTTNYGPAAYAQLSQSCPQEIRQGSEDGSEIGTFNLLRQSQREDNLQALLDEYLRFGLKAGIFYMT